MAGVATPKTTASRQAAAGSRQDGIAQVWRVMPPLLTSPPPVHSYTKGSWGPEAAEGLAAGHGRWHAPWTA